MSQRENGEDVVAQALAAIILHQGGKVTVPRSIAIEHDLDRYYIDMTEHANGDYYEFTVRKKGVLCR